MGGFSPADAMRRTLVRQVRNTFNDQSQGERPIPASDNAIYARDTVVWRVHGDVTPMMVGGVAALLTQMLHPAALAGVWDHSDVAADRLGRLRRTARFIAVTTYGERDAAEQAIAKVRSIHQQVQGTLPDGTPYRADDPALLAWVHVAGAIMFLDGWRRYAEPRMSRADQDRYFAEARTVAEMLGADPVPEEPRRGRAADRKLPPAASLRRAHACIPPDSAGFAGAEVERRAGAEAADGRSGGPAAVLRSPSPSADPAAVAAAAGPGRHLRIGRDAALGLRVGVLSLGQLPGRGRRARRGAWR